MIDSFLCDKNILSYIVKSRRILSYIIISYGRILSNLVVECRILSHIVVYWYIILSNLVVYCHSLLFIVMTTGTLGSCQRSIVIPVTVSLCHVVIILCSD